MTAPRAKKHHQGDKGVSDAGTGADRLIPSERKLVLWGKRQDRRDGERGILLEGEKLVEEALTAGHPLVAGWHTGTFAASRPGFIARIGGSGCRLRRVSSRTMRWISELDTPPGIAVVCPQPGFVHRRPGDPFSLIVVLTLVQDPGNLGGIIRTADYFGVDELWLGPGSADPYGPKAVRGAMGATLRMPVLMPTDLPGRIGQFRQEGAEVWAAVAHETDTEMRISPSGSRILLLGGESRGLLPDEVSLADRKVSIPGARRSESLNLAVAAGILIHSATTDRYRGA